MPMIFPKAAVAPPGRAARAPITSSATTAPVVAPALPPLGQPLRGAHWAARSPPADPASRLAGSSVVFACRRPLAGSALVDRVLTGAQGVCVPSGRGGIRPGGGGRRRWASPRRQLCRVVLRPCGRAGNEVPEEAVVARSTVSCFLLPHRAHPRRACGFLVLLPPVKWLLSH